MPDHRSTPGLTRRAALQRVGAASASWAAQCSARTRRLPQRNATDRIYARQGGSGSTVQLSRRSSSSIRQGFVGRVTLAIDT